MRMEQQQQESRVERGVTLGIVLEQNREEKEEDFLHITHLKNEKNNRYFQNLLFSQSISRTKKAPKKIFIQFSG